MTRSTPKLCEMAGVAMATSRDERADGARREQVVFRGYSAIRLETATRGTLFFKPSSLINIEGKIELKVTYKQMYTLSWLYSCVVL